MGTLGPGVFNNDAAHDWLVYHAKKVVAEIKRHIFDFDEDHGESLLAAVDLLTVLSKHYKLQLIDQETAENWRVNYLKNWTKYIATLRPKAGFVESQTAVIHQTFDALKAVATPGSSW